MKYFKILLAGLVIFLLTSCTIKPVELKSIDSVDINLKNGLLVKAEITLYNPNGIKLGIDDIDIDVYAESLYLGKLMAPDLTVIERKGDFKTSFEVKVEKQKMFSLGLQAMSILGKKELNLKLKGSLKVKHWLVNRTIDIDTTEKVKL